MHTKTISHFSQKSKKNQKVPGQAVFGCRTQRANARVVLSVADLAHGREDGDSFGEAEMPSSVSFPGRAMWPGRVPPR